MSMTIEKRPINRNWVVSVITILLVIACLGTTACAPKSPSTEIVFGALLPLTGDLSASGESTQAALELAVSDINGYLSNIDAETRVRLIIEDTGTDPVVALEKLKSLVKNGVKIVIGPDSSGEVEAVKAYADEENILIISHASTAPSLAISGDNIFRFVPDDTHQAEAVATLMWQDGIRAIIAMYRGDVWGDDLFQAAKDNFEKLGGTVINGIRYEPETTDFTVEMEAMDSNVTQAVAQYGIRSVAVYLLSFEEVVSIFNQAQNYPILSSLNWYGSDSTALSNALIKNSQAAQFAIKTNFINPMYGAESGPVRDNIKEKITRDPEVYSLAAYDALWVAVKACLATQTKDIEALRNALWQEAESYHGTTGWTVLNDAGDRMSGDYIFWVLRDESGVFAWDTQARYEFRPDSVGNLVFESEPLLAPELKVLVVHSYHESWGWNQDIQNGIIEGLGRQGYTEGQDFELEAFYMDTKITYITPEQIQERGSMALDIIREYEPDIVFVNDDDALKYVAVAYTEKYPDDSLPFVVSGTNLDPSIYAPIKSLETPDGTITGALERFPYYDAFALGKRIVPSASRIVLMTDASSSSTFVVDTFKERYLDRVSDSPLQIIGPIQVTTFEEWKQKIAEYQTKADLLGILTYHQLRDEKGNVVPAPVVVDWTVHNSSLPEIGILTFHAEDGFMAALGVSGYKTGIYVGVLGGQILGGTDPGTIPILDPQATDIAFNLERAAMLGINIPIQELIAADVVFQTIGSTRF